MDKKLPTYVNIILDRSGSMEPVWNKMFGALREYVNAFKKKKNVYFTFYLFDGWNNETEIEQIYKLESFADVDLNDVQDEYEPRGWTPLYDAACMILDELQDVLKHEESGNVLVALITDGEENSSRKYDKKKLQRMIERLERKKWTFTYLGANQDSMGEVSHFTGQSAVLRTNTQNWDFSDPSFAMRELTRGTQTVYAASAEGCLKSVSNIYGTKKGAGDPSKS